MRYIYPYRLESESGGLYKYIFTSIGRQGEIKKVVTFKEMVPGLYNVLLQDEVNGELSNDIKVTNNGDTLKVINTVAVIIKEVVSVSLGYTIHFAGSDPRRNSIYQRRIKRELGSKEYMMLGATETGGDFVSIEEDVEYVAFLVLHK